MQRLYEHIYTTTYGDFDPNGLIRPAALADLMQDLAMYHASHLGLDQPGRRIAWAMTRMRFVCSRPVTIGEDLLLKTWCCGTKGPNWLRDFSFSTKDGQPIGQASTYWVLLDVDNQRILRPSAIASPEDYILPDHTPAVPPERLRFSNPETCRTHQVSYSDLDANQHMNNAKILDLVCNGLELHLRQGQYLQDLQVAYKTQCLYDEEIILRRESTNRNTLLLQGCTETEVKFEACARLAPIPNRK